MATRQTATIARTMRLPSIVLLLIWMIIPLALFMLPALFALILGPAAMQLAQTMSGLSLQ